jgi:hypothetical protein
MLQKRQRGIALVSVLSVATVAIILAASFSFVITTERQATTAATVISDSVQLADAASERARLTVVDEYKKSFLTSENFLRALDEGTISNLSGIVAETIDAQAVHWEIRDWANPDTSTFHWLDIAATAETGKGTQTVIRRINLGQSDIFTLAMLSEDTNCIYCHLRVNGDVGSLNTFRPGWGDELNGVAPTEGWEDGWNSGASGGGSEIDGDVFAAQTITADGDAGTINGVTVSGTIFTNYNESRLPRDKDGDGIADFPEINRTVAENNAEGTVSGGVLIYTVPSGSVLAAVPGSSNQGSVSDSFDGNVILVGSEANPLVIDQDVYFSGDVIIKGYVSGRGAIYAGRNLYVAGNISYDDPPSNCADAANPDTCAQNAITSNKDELRLAARGNIIMGDYTEADASGNPKLWQGLQSVDYYRSQFGFYADETNYYDKTNGDELELIDGEYKNVDGTVISSGSVVSVAGDEAYDYSMSPGTVTSGGSFQPWLSDGLYQGILGTEKRAYDSWRKNIASGRSSVTKAELQTQLAQYGLADASLDALLCSSSCPTSESINLQNASGEVIGLAHWSQADEGGDNLRIVIDPVFEYEKQVTHVDAYLYSNQRIAGKTFGAPLVINGGMVSKEIGVLAPGIAKQWYMEESRYDFLDTAENDCSNQSFANNFRDTSITSETDAGYYNGAFDPNADDCALTVNYDYRLRNGGFGYNLVAKDVGRTVSWELGSRRSDRVNP